MFCTLWERKFVEENWRKNRKRRRRRRRAVSICVILMELMKIEHEIEYPIRTTGKMQSSIGSQKKVLTNNRHNEIILKKGIWSTFLLIVHYTEAARLIRKTQSNPWNRSTSKAKTDFFFSCSVLFHFFFHFKSFVFQELT